MPVVQVSMVAGRTPEQKQALLAAVTTAVQETLSAPLESIRVWICEVPAAEFMSGGELMSDRRARQDQLG